MAAKVKKVKLGKTVTPKGKSYFSYVTKPDSYNEDVYIAKMIVSGEDIAEWKEKVDEMAEKVRDELGLKPNAQLYLPYTEEEDEDGEPTGNYIVKAKRKVKIGMPKLVDAKGVPFTPSDDFYIPNGSTIRISGVLEGISAGKVKAVTFYLNAVQVIDLEDGSGDLGFEEEDGGFSADNIPTRPTQAQTTASDDEEDEEAYDEEDF